MVSLLGCNTDSFEETSDNNLLNRLIPKDRIVLPTAISPREVERNDQVILRPEQAVDYTCNRSCPSVVPVVQEQGEGPPEVVIAFITVGILQSPLETRASLSRMVENALHLLVARDLPDKLKTSPLVQNR